MPKIEFDKKPRKFSPKFEKTKQWFLNHKEGFAVDIAKSIGCDRTQFAGYCDKLIAEEQLLVKSKKKIPHTNTSGVYYSLHANHETGNNHSDFLHLLDGLSFLTKEERKEYAKGGPHSEGKNKKASYGRTEAEAQAAAQTKQFLISQKERQRVINNLHEQIKPKKTKSKKLITCSV